MAYFQMRNGAELLMELQDVALNSLVVLTFASFPWRRLALNLIRSLEQVDHSGLTICFDEEIQNFLSKLKKPTYLATSLSLNETNVSAARDRRSTAALYHHFMVRKEQIKLFTIQNSFHLLSLDSDTVMLQNFWTQMHDALWTYDVISQGVGCNSRMKCRLPICGGMHYIQANNATREGLEAAVHEIYWGRSHQSALNRCLGSRSRTIKTLGPDIMPFLDQYGTYCDSNSSHHVLGTGKILAVHAAKHGGYKCTSHIQQTPMVVAHDVKFKRQELIKAHLWYLNDTFR